MKNFVKFFVGGLISLLLVVLLSCGEDAGLGSTVDTEAPKLSISYPPAAAYVRGEFVFAGTCSDDKGVTRVEVTVKNLDTGKTYDTVLAKIENSLTWSININKQTASGFELSDGKYMLEVTAYDKSGRSSGTSSRQFDIDNTPPVFVITKPGVNRKVYLSENSISKYGSLFSIEGTIADDHSIASMDVTIYDKDGNPVASEPYSEKEISTTGGTSVTIARFIENGVDASNLRYNEIYSVGDADASGNKVYSCTVTVADSTKEYKNPGDNGTEGGNSTSVVYLYDDVYDEYMSAKKGAGLSANDFRSVLNGTATNESLSGKGIATDVTVEKVLTALKNFAKDTTNIEDNSLSFSLNPNADPTYNISGFNLNYNEAGTAIAAGTNKAMGEQPLTVIVSQGLDNVPIVPKSLKIYIKKIIEADKAHITKNTLNKSISDLVTKVSELEIDLANASESLDTEKQKEAEAQLSVIDGWNLLLDNSEDNSPSEATYTLSLTLPANNYIEANAYYAIVVTGNDKDGIKLSQTKNFGFIGTISAVPPSASFTSPADSQSFANSKAETLSFTGTATENNAGMTLRKITAILTASDESTGKEVDGKVEVTIEGNSDKIWGNVPGLSCYYDEAEKTNKWTFTPALCNGYDTLKAEEEGLQYAYKATIKVTGTGELTAETSRSIKIDTKKPVVAITSVSPVVYGKEYFGEDSQYKDYTFINSTISIQGSITENNLSSVTYDVRASADLNADLSDEKYSILAGLKEFSEKNGEIVVDGDLGRISSIEQKFHTDLITNYLIASKQISKDQPVKARIVLRAKDLVGNVGEYNSSESNEGKDFFVYQETDRPKITLGNSELSYKVGVATKSLLVDEKGENKGNINYEHNLFGTTNNNKLSLSFTDDDSVVEYDIFIAKNGENFAKDEKGNEKPDYTATPNKTSASVNFVLPEEEGVYKVKVVARDFLRSETKTDATQVYGVQVIGPFYIAVDSGAPTLSLSNPQNGAFVSRNSGIDGGVKGTVSKKGTKISGFIYKLGDTTKTQLITVTDVTIDEENPVNEVYNWTGKITRMPEKEQGDNFKLEITSLDAYGQSSTISANLGIDETAPVVKLNADEETQILESNPNYSVKNNKKRYLVSGTWSDVGTGTSELYCAYANEVENNEPKWIYLNGTKEGSEDPKPVEGTANSTAETSFNIYIPLTEGASFAYKVWGKDAAGNITTPSEEDGTLVKGITVDLGTPTIEKTTGAVPQYIKKDGTLTITGKAEDSYGLKEITAKVKLNGADIASGNKGYTFTPVIAENKKSGTFTIELSAADTNNGAWTFEIHAVDLAGRESGTLNYNTVVDTKRPVWDADSFQVNKAPYVSGTNHTWYKASSLPFAGMYSEEGSGIDHVEYTVIKAGETTGTTETFGTTKVTDASGNFTGEESFSANLGEFARKIDASGTLPNIVKFVAVDKAGNKSEEQTVEIYIDTEAPSLESLVTGSQYSNTVDPIEVTGNASDDSSGIAKVTLELYEDGNTDKKGEEITAISTAAAGAGAYATWKAEIPADRLSNLENKPHSVKAIVIDGAGNKTTLTIFKINVDTDKPAISNISFTNTSEKYSVYQTEETVTGSTEKIATYYVHNNDGNKFSIYGSIMDQTSGIKKIELLEGSAPVRDPVTSLPITVSSLPITGIDFSDRTGSANLTLKATDNAGNVTEFPLVVKFDNTPPMGIHAIDKSNKDIFFRISDLNNWKWDGTEGEIENWDASLDEDIGGKYSPTSYGKNQTVRVRGNISDKESGVDMIYYKVISAGTDEMAQEDTTNAAGETVKGLVNIAKEFLENYKNDNNGYFRANKIEEKRITYTSIGEADKVYDTNGNLVVLRGTDETKNDGTDTIFEGLVKNFGACHGQESVTDSPKHYATVTTNYDNSFTGFKDGYNYLILVAVDNVGNASLDTVKAVYGGITTEYSSFTLNVDTVTPELQSEQSGQVLTNGAAPLKLNGKFTDNFAGVKTIVLDLINTSTKNTVKTFTLDSSSESSDANNPNKGFLTTSGTWGITISKDDLKALDTAVYSVKATVTDRAGNQWPQNIFTIQKDATPPEITNVKLTQQSSTYKIYKPNENEDEYYVNPSDGKFTIEGGATDNYGIKKIELVIPGYSGTITPVEDKGSFEFKELDLSTLTGDEVTVTLKVTDTAGNTLATDKTIKLVFDKSSPEWDSTTVLKINDKEVNTETGVNNWFKDTLLKFEGAYTELGSGIEKVTYEITKAGSSSSDPKVTGQFETTRSNTLETFIANLSGFTSKTGDTGVNYNLVEFKAYDKVGNPSASHTVNIYLDMETPEIETAVTSNIITNGKLKDTTATDTTVVIGYTGEDAYDNYTIRGTVDDVTSGISSLSISANGLAGLTIDSTHTDYGTIKIWDDETEQNPNKKKWAVTLNKKFFVDAKAKLSTNKKSINLSLTALDNAGEGNRMSESAATILFDIEPPVVTLKSPTDAYTETKNIIEINGIISLSGTVTDDNTLPENGTDDESNTIMAIEYSTSNADNATWQPLTVTSITGNYTFAVSGFDTTQLTDEETYYLRAKAVDIAGNIGYSPTVEVKVAQNTDRPIIKITTLTDANAWLTQKTLRGSISDDDGLTGLTFAISENGTATNPTPVTVTNGSWTYTFSGAAGENDGEKALSFKVVDNQTTTFVTGSTVTFTGTTKYKRPYYLYDSTTASVYASTTSTECGLSADSAVTIKLDTAPPKLYTLGMDISTKKELDSASYVAKANSNYTINDSSKAGGNSKYIKFYVPVFETNLDRITISIADAISGIVETKYSTDANATKKFSAEGVLELTETSPAATITDSETTSTTYTYYESSPITIASDAETKLKTLKVVAYDQAGNETLSSANFYVDNTGPEDIVVTSPSMTDEVTGTISIVGTASDVGSAGISSIQWLVPSKDYTSTMTDAELAGLNWVSDNNTKGSASVWNFKFLAGSATDLTVYDDTAKYKVEHNETTNIYKIPLFFKTTDTLGNVYIKRDFYVTHNPDADRPVTEFNYPTTSDYDSNKNYVTLAGTIRVSGTVEIPSGTTDVGQVYIQIGTVAEDGTITWTSDNVALANEFATLATIVENGGVKTKTDLDNTYYSEDSNGQKTSKVLYVQDDWWGIPVTTKTATWNISLNSDGKLDPSSSTTNIALRACAINADGKMGLWTDAKTTDPIYIHVDANAPGQTAVMRQYSTFSSSAMESNVSLQKDYSPEMYLKGKWYAVVTIKDNDSLDVATLKVKRGSVNLTKDAASNGYYLSSKTWEYTEGEATTGDSAESGRTVKSVSQKVYIPVDTEAIGSTSVNYSVYIEDTSHFASTMTYNFFIDNKAPEFSTLTGNSDDLLAASPAGIENSNYVYNLGGKLKEDGSGFSRIFFYFLRNNVSDSSNPRVLDAMLDYSTAGNDGRIATVTDRETNYESYFEAFTGALDTYTVTQGTSSFTMYGKTYAGNLGEDGKTFTSTAESLADNKHVRAGGLIFIGGDYHKIVSVSGNNVTFDDEVSTTVTEAGFPYGQVVDHTEKSDQDASTHHYNITGDDGDGMPESAITVSGTTTWEGTIYSDQMTDGPVTLVCIAFDKAGNVAEKQIATRIKNNAPRLAKLYLGTDLGGNGKYGDNEFNTYQFVNAEADGTYKDAHGNFKESVTLATGGTDYSNYGKPFEIRSGLAVVPEITGGNGEIKLAYFKSATGASEVNKDDASVFRGVDTSDKIEASFSPITNATTGKVDSVHKFLLETRSATDNDFKDLADGTGKKMSFTFWDSTDGTVCGTDSNCCFVYVTDFTVALNDSVVPKSVIDPFYWNSLTDNSIYDSANATKTSQLKGHIELESDWTAKVGDKYLASGYDANATSGEYDGDPKVSGKITLTGYAYDDQRLSSLWVAFDGFEPASGTYFSSVGDYALKTKDNVTAIAGTYKNSGTNGDSKTYYQAAYYTPSSEKWLAATSVIGYDSAKKEAVVTQRTDGTTMAGNGWEFSVTYETSDKDEVYLSQKGHKVKWTLSIDTEKCNPIAATDIKARVIAFDHNGNVVKVSGNVTVNGTSVSVIKKNSTNIDGSDNVPLYQMDVVPYIREISNRTGQAQEDKSVFGRSATGAYPIYYYTNVAGTTVTKKETFTISGFNFGENPLVRLPGDDAVTGTSIDVSKNMTSGEVTVTVGTGENAVVSLNNNNNNESKGSYSATNTSGYDKYVNYYNRQPNRTNNSTLTDDCVVKVWNIKQVENDKSVRYPSMRVGNNTVGFVYASGSDAVKMKLGDNAAYLLDTSWTQWYDTAVAVDNRGQIYGAAQNGDTGGSGNYLRTNDRYYYGKANYKMYAFNSTNAHGILYDGTGGAYSSGGRSVALENIQHGTTAYSQRVRNPKIVANSSASGSGTAYTVYYDSATNTVKFRNGVITATENSDNYHTYSYTDAYDDYRTKTTTTSYAATTFGDSLAGRASGSESAAGATVIADDTNAGEYVGLGVTKNGKAVVAWYNSSAQALYYKFQNDTGWSDEVPIDTGFVGWYVDLVVDNTDGVHIAYYDAGNGDLKYAYIEDYRYPTGTTGKAAKKTMIVDHYLSTGTNISISVKNTGSETAPVWTPYISYFMSAFNKTSFTVRSAWLANGSDLKTKTAAQLAGVNGDDFTGVWEVMTVPLAKESIPLDYSVGIGIKNNQPILGYGTQEGLETAELK